MILILGGTTEGRLAVRVADEAGSPYYYSTRGKLQKIVCKYGTRVTGGMDFTSMNDFCRTHSIRLLIDAAHPFAVELHQTVAQVAEALFMQAVNNKQRCVLVVNVYKDGATSVSDLLIDGKSIKTLAAERCAKKK